jgi:hypothetical protein
MSIRIVDRKRFVIFILASAFLIVSFFYGGYLLINKFVPKKKFNEVQREVSVKNIAITEDKVDEENIQKNISESERNFENERANEAIIAEYENTTYKYSLTFPEKWFMNNDDSETALNKLITEDGMELTLGGQTFWSNYQNINNYDSQNKPEDFHLLSLTIYQDSAKNVDEFAKKLGFKNDLVREEFAIENGQGVQLVAQGLLAKNPRIIVLFQKNNKFFVFRPAFLNGDAAATDAMELIVKSFKFTD